MRKPLMDPLVMQRRDSDLTGLGAVQPEQLHGNGKVRARDRKSYRKAMITYYTTLAIAIAI